MTITAITINVIPIQAVGRSFTVSGMFSHAPGVPETFTFFDDHGKQHTVKPTKFTKAVPRYSFVHPAYKSPGTYTIKVHAVGQPKSTVSNAFKVVKASRLRLAWLRIMGS